MQGQEILSVVVAVRGADDGVHMLLAHAGRPSRRLPDRSEVLTVKLDEQHGTVDAVVDGRVLVGGSVPGEPGFRHVLLDLGHLELGLPVVDVPDVQLDELPQPRPLRRRQITGIDAS